MLEIKNIKISFVKKQVLKGLSGNWETGKIHGVVGHNGAGKTTLFNILTGIEKADDGEILWNGSPLKPDDIGYLETNNFFYSRITPNDYLSLFPASNEQFDLAAFQAFFQLPLYELIEYYSTGMKKKLALLDILLLDEPFNGLDLETNKVLEVTLDLLKQKQKTIIMSSHVLAPLLEVCDYIHYLAAGVIEKTYTRDQFSEIEKLLFEDLKIKARKGLGEAI